MINGNLREMEPRTTTTSIRRMDERSTMVDNENTTNNFNKRDDLQLPVLMERSTNNELSAASLGLMASGLAWVRRQNNNVFGPSSSTSSSNPPSFLDEECLDQQEQIKKRLRQQQYHSKYSHIFNPDQPKETTPVTPPSDKPLVQSCPTSPNENSISSLVPRFSMSTNNTPAKAAPPPPPAPPIQPVNSILATSPSSGLEPPQQHQLQDIEPEPAPTLHCYSTVEDEPDLSLGFFCQKNTSYDDSWLTSTATQQEEEQPAIQTCATAPWTPSSRNTTKNTPTTIQSCPTTPNEDHSNSIMASLARFSLTAHNTPVRPDQGGGLSSLLVPVNRMHSLYDTAAQDDLGLLQTPQQQNQGGLGCYNTTVEEEEEVAHSSLGYFCQNNAATSVQQDSLLSRQDMTHSPMRTALTVMLSRIGSYDPDEEDDEGHQREDSGYDSDDEEANSIAWIPPVRCVAESHPPSSSSSSPPPSFILEPKQMLQIARHVLPKGIAACQWQRLYSVARDGDSLETCLHYVRRNDKTLLVIRTTRGAVFGAYVGEAWADKGRQYYGNNETRLFTFHVVANGNCSGSQEKKEASGPVAAKKSLVDDDDDEEEGPPLRVFRYTGVNRYIQLCDASKTMLALGGGGDAFGLCVEQNFQTGSTESCDTFDNAPLCPQTNFKIVDLEIWGFLTGQF